MKTKKASIAVQIIELVYKNSSHNSYAKLNYALSNVLYSICVSGVDFEIDDYKNIIEDFKGLYWMGVSSNGKHFGEYFYRAGNDSFCFSYEKYTGRIPFILNNNRVHEGSQFTFDNKCCHITGWSADNKTIHFVGYDNGMKETGKKLYKFDRNEWLKIRSLITK